MSDAEDDDGGISDIDVDDDVVDFDPLVDHEDDDDEDDDAAGSDNEDVEEEAEDGAESLEDDAGAEAAPGRAKPFAETKRHGPPPEPARAQRGASRDRQATRAADTRRILIVPAEERITSNVMMRAEMTRAIALRAQQIARYPNAYTSAKGLTHAKDVALKELYERQSPLVLRRTVGWTPAGERLVEKWPVREMTYRPLN